MNEKTTDISLSSLLPLMFPESARIAWSRPSKEQRKALFGEEDGEVFFDTPLALSLKHSEGILLLRGLARRITKREKEYILEEEIATEHMVGTAPLREALLFQAKILSLALMNAKKIERLTFRLLFFSEGRAEMESFLFEKEALSTDFSEFAPRIFALAPLFEKADALVEFPHSSLRQGQKKLIQSVWSAIGSSTKLFACAPTGIGKTAAVLYPALRALEKGKADRVFYASPKNTLKLQAAACIESLQKVRGFRTLVLSSKAALCPEKKEDCKKEECSYFENTEASLSEALSFLAAFSCITEKELRAAAEHFHLCPFALAKKIAEFCQIIVGDYNHVFDPDRAVFRPSKQSVLLVDEAHNLAGRIKENHTETISPSDFDPLFRDSTAPAGYLREHFAPLCTLFAAMDQKRKDTKEYYSFKTPEKIGKAAEELLPKIGFALTGGFGLLSPETEEEIKKLFFKFKKFVSLYRKFNENYATVYPPEGGCRIWLVDPRSVLKEAFEKWKSVVLFSATLLPEAYYFDLLAGEECDEFLTLPSPFCRDHLFVGICGIDVSHSQRYLTAPKICNIIHSAVSAKEGNYMVFLPSFEYLNLVSQEYKKRHFEHRVLIQEKVMSAAKRRKFLQEFQENKKGTLVGFVVMGGIFSEGIDLKGDALLGEIIVGTGFPPPSPEAEAECEAYYKREMDGKKFAYTLQGWSRVLQAAGRVIRSEEDRGILLLCDLRFLGEEVRELFPEHWEGAEIIEREKELRDHLKTFWE